jgi:hypothetical protein
MVTQAVGTCPLRALMATGNLANKFKQSLLDPDAWEQTAQHLFCAAALLEPKIDEFWNRRRSGVGGSSSWRSWDDEFVAIYFMLRTYAIENLLKAKIIQKKRVQLEAKLQSSKVLPKQLRQHDLYQLALDAGLGALAKEEEALLRRLTRSSVWYGRYPVPLTDEGLNPMYDSQNHDFTLSLTQYASTDRTNIRRIAKELGYKFP